MENELEDAVREWLTLPMQHADYNPILNEYLEKRGIKATVEEMVEAIDKVTEDLKKGNPT